MTDHAPPRNLTARDHSRSRLVRILKITLPLLALAVLSSLFLFARVITLDGTLPFADFDLADRLREPKMTDVRLATTTDKGAVLEMSADAVVPLTPQQTLARNAAGTITPATGDATRFSAPRVTFDDQAGTASLTGGVQISAADYTMTTQEMDVDTLAASLHSRTEVRAKGPLGTLTAGQMHVQQNAGGLYIVFNSGVQLVYMPQ